MLSLDTESIMYSTKHHPKESSVSGHVDKCIFKLSDICHITIPSLHPTLLTWGLHYEQAEHFSINGVIITKV